MPRIIALLNLTISQLSESALNLIYETVDMVMEVQFIHQILTKTKESDQLWVIMRLPEIPGSFWLGCRSIQVQRPETKWIILTDEYQENQFYNELQFLKNYQFSTRLQLENSIRLQTSSV